MSFSNRDYLCVVCGQLRRAALPPGLVHHNALTRPHLLALPEGKTFKRPLLYGHWRSWLLPADHEFPQWLHHCGKPLFLLGKRAAQAATQITPAERLLWIKLGARVTKHRGRKRWRPVLSESRLKDAYPLI